MTITIDEVSVAVGQASSDELDGAMRNINHCLSQLTDEQIWWRPAESMNSIANLMLHLCGNLRQWIVSGVGDTEDVRNRPQEFSERGPLSKEELLRRIEAVVSEANSVLARVTPSELLRTRRIQSFDVTGMQAIFESTAHFRGHTQEIVHMTRCKLGDDYEFAFVPATPEQGAPEE